MTASSATGDAVAHRAARRAHRAPRPVAPVAPVRVGVGGIARARDVVIPACIASSCGVGRPSSVVVDRARYPRGHMYTRNFCQTIFFRDY